MDKKTVLWMGSRISPALIILSLGVGARGLFSTTVGLIVEQVLSASTRTRIRFPHIKPVRVIRKVPTQDVNKNEGTKTTEANSPGLLTSLIGELYP